MDNYPVVDNTQQEMKDIQQELPNLPIQINTVGIKNFKLPIFILTREDGFQHTVADIDAFVSLQANKKGINMSRLPIGLQKFVGKQLDAKMIAKIAKYIRQKSEAEQCQLIYRFPYFIRKIAPVSNEIGLVYYNIVFNIIEKENNINFKMSVETTGMSLCPCSKEISDGQGAHCQRSKINIEIQPLEDHFIWIEDIIEISEKSCACSIYSVLKRPDEKFVTQYSYNNPHFVEDIGRSCYEKLQNRKDISWFKIEVSNEESIHQHDAYCKIESGEIK